MRNEGWARVEPLDGSYRTPIQDLPAQLPASDPRLGCRGPINTSSPWPRPTTVNAHSALDHALHSWWQDLDLARGRGSLLARSGCVSGWVRVRGRGASGREGSVLPGWSSTPSGCAEPVGC